MPAPSTAPGRIGPPARESAATVREAEFTAFRTLVSTLESQEWRRPTLSAGWLVRDVVAHVAGQYEELARIAVFLRRLRTARRRYPDRTTLDGHNQVQVDELAGQPPAALVARLDRYGPAALRALRRIPGPRRRLPSSLFFPEPPLPERALSYLFDVLSPRDTWMHRLEVARATGRTFTIAGHDRQIVDQVVRDLDRQWNGPALTLELTGPAGRRATIGHGASQRIVGVDAVELLLHLSGRRSDAQLEGCLLDQARVVF